MIETLINIIPVVATFFLIVCYFPQLIQTYTTKDVSSISLSFFVMLNIALTLLLINSILLYIQSGSWGYIVTYIFNEGLAFLMLVMILKYRKKKTK